jgi:hypothetical protein
MWDAIRHEAVEIVWLATMMTTLSVAGVSLAVLLVSA